MGNITGSSNVNRLYGLSGSGIDVDSLVKQSMAAAKIPYTQLWQKQQVDLLKKDAYNSMYTSINTFKDTKVTNFELQSSLVPKAVTSSLASVATITANSDAPNVTHSLTVNQLASGIAETSSASITIANGKKDTLANQVGMIGSTAFMINGKTVNVSSTQSINDVVSNINSANAGVTATYDTNTDRLYLYSNNTGASSGIDFTGTNTAGLNFLNQQLKLNTYTAVDNTGVTSSTNVAVNQTAALNSQFTGLAASFNLSITNGTGTATVAVNTATDSISSMITNINTQLTANGINGTASFDGSKFTIKSTDANAAVKLDLSGSDPSGQSFLTTNMGLSTLTNIGQSGVTSTSALSLTNTATNTIGQQFSSLTAGSFNLKLFDGTTTSTININTATDSIDSILNKINSDPNGLAAASYANGKFTLTAKNSGASLDLSGSDAATLNFLNNQLNMNLSTNRKGQDAQIKLDGISMTQSSNQFTVASVKYSLLSTGTTNVGVSTDVDKIVSNVQAFVSDYNTQLASLYSKINEAYDKTYQPLTDDQKSAMNVTDISLWTDKTKVGLLHNDSTLKNLAESMRDAFGSPVSGISGNYTSAASIGITEGDYTENGKIYVDETQLRAALAADPNAAYKIFGTSGDATTNSPTNGIAVNLNKLLSTAASQIVTEAGTTSTATTDFTSALGMEINDMTTSLSTMNDKLNTQQSELYTKYNAMEAAYSKMSQQASYVTSLLSSSG